VSRGRCTGSVASASSRAARKPIKIAELALFPYRRLALMAGLKQAGEQLTAEWLRKAGAGGLAVIEAYKKNRGPYSREQGFET
jgi:hypothetical protein